MNLPVAPSSLTELLRKGIAMGVEADFVRRIFAGLEHGDVAIVELHSRATAKNGFRFDNHYCWVCYFRNNKIVRVRAYLDSAMVARLFAENPI
ncbi:MAG TPA: hypothetical protein VGQ19_07570 [Burkholderiales bacterium]|nr:hypothetical protein [Burkholderiales bacterium]